MPVSPGVIAGTPSTCRLTLLVRAYCSLCETMQQSVAELAARFGASVELIDVDARPALETRWGELVPVLFIGDPAPEHELCHYTLDVGRVTTVLRAAALRNHPEHSRDEDENPLKFNT